MTESLTENSTRTDHSQEISHFVAQLRQHGVIKTLSDIETGAAHSSTDAALKAEYFRYNRITELEAEVARTAYKKQVERERKLKEARNFISHF